MARKNNGEPKTFAYEEFMARARKEGRVRNEELSMKVLKPDLSLQARVNHINVDHVRALHDILKNGQPLAPIIVFEIEELRGKTVVKTFKIADGFHRHEVYKRDGKPGIPCVVVSGTLQEAIEYAASANQTLSLKRSREDAKKAVFMLLRSGWHVRPATHIAAQAGVGVVSAQKYLAEYSEITGIQLPEKVVCGNGSLKHRSAARAGDIRRESGGRGREVFAARWGGEVVRRSTPEAARDAAQDLAREHEAAAKRITCNLGTLLAHRGISYRGCQQTPGVNMVQGGMAATRFAVTSLTEPFGNPFRYQSAIHTAVGRVLLIGRAFSLKRHVVLCVDNPRFCDDLLGLARRLGVEFMTLDEFVAAVKAEQRDSAPVAANA